MAKRLPSWLLIPAVGLVGWQLGKLLGGPAGGRVGAHPFPQPANRGVPFAVGGNPVWPIPKSRNPRRWEVAYKDVEGRWHGNMARAFKASRSDGARYHVGIDLYANAGDVVVAPESGVVVGRQTFLAGTGAMLIRLDSGVTVLLGEVVMGAAKDYGVKVGTRVRRGQPVTRVGLNDYGTSMLHLETYGCCPTKNVRWYRNDKPPAVIRDPTDWLLRAKANSRRVA